MRNRRLCLILMSAALLGVLPVSAQETAAPAAAASVPAATPAAPEPAPAATPAESAAKLPPPLAPGATPLPPATPVTAPAAPEVPAPAAAQGDVIVFKTKKRLENVQVIRETGQRVFVKTFEGMEPISIPRDQIENIEYDEVNDSGISAKPSGREGEGAIAGTQVSAELSRKLTQTLAENALSKDDIPFSEALEQLAKKTEVTIEMTDAAKKMLAEVRAKDITVDAKATMLSFLRETLKERFPELDVRLMFDKVVLAKKGEPQADAAAPTPSAAPPEKGSATAPAAAAPAATPETAPVAVPPAASPEKTPVEAASAAPEKAPEAPKNP